MIIFESILTTFEASVVFWGSWGSRGKLAQVYNQITITNFNQVKLFLITDTNCTKATAMIVASWKQFAKHGWKVIRNSLTFFKVYFLKCSEESVVVASFKKWRCFCVNLLIIHQLLLLLLLSPSKVFSSDSRRLNKDN